MSASDAASPKRQGWHEVEEIAMPPEVALRTEFFGGMGLRFHLQSRVGARWLCFRGSGFRLAKRRHRINHQSTTRWL